MVLNCDRCIVTTVIPHDDEGAFAVSELVASNAKVETAAATVRRYDHLHIELEWFACAFKSLGKIEKLGIGFQGTTIVGHADRFKGAGEDISSEGVAPQGADGNP
jgi:hypothetical protein